VVEESGMSDEKKYKYAGDGAGLPGLPNEVTEAEAEAAGMLEVLQAAVSLGMYVEINPVLDLPRSKKIAEGRKGNQLKDEVRNG
jgi:hypothetical protein